jgi:hypothetical protein
MGSIIQIPLGGDSASLGIILKEPVIGFYDKLSSKNDAPSHDEIANLPLVFRLMVMNHAVTSGRWPILYKGTVPKDLTMPPPFCKQDLLTGKLSIYQEIPELAPFYERPATAEECEGLETASVWEPEHVEDRLRDHFAGRENRWVRQLKIS